MPRRAGTLIMLFILFFLSAGSGALAETRKEYAVKAAFVYNFMKFIQWPDNTFPNETAPYRLCFTGDSVVAEQFNTLNGKMNGNRPIHVRRLNPWEECRDCDLLFISRKTGRDTSAKFLRQLKGKPVLTIGESKGFAHSGGIINFFTKGDHLQFEINPEAARHQGFKLSSRLLKLAIIVDGD